MAEFEKRLACVIAADGSIGRGYMIESCELVGANEYHLEGPPAEGSEDQLLLRDRQRRLRRRRARRLHCRPLG